VVSRLTVPGEQHHEQHAAPASQASDRAYCYQMLPRVSRTFALCIPLLPPRLEYATLVAYLVCRVADTIEDAPTLEGGEKGRLLHTWADALEEGGPAGLGTVFAEPASDDERLVNHADVVRREFHRLPLAHREAVRPWVREMCGGMAEFAQRPLGGIGTLEDLDRYTYYVAGTVGHLLTRLFRLHDPRPAGRRYERLEALATGFGRGLQLTNIIKDVADDRRRGSSFIPRQLCHLAGIRPEELQDQRHRREARRVVLALIEKAKRHLNEALAYSTTIPRRLYGVRLFCLTSLFFAVRTLRLAERDTRLLDPDHKVKISRAEVHRTLVATRLIAPSNALVRWYFRLLAGGRWPASRAPAPA
jgi:farnesyl-diphosphate farnesyltransferase